MTDSSSKKSVSQTSSPEVKVKVKIKLKKFGSLGSKDSSSK